MASSLWPLLSFAIAVITYCSSICAAAASQPAVAATLRSRRLLSEEEAPYGYCMCVQRPEFNIARVVARVCWLTRL